MKIKNFTIFASLVVAATAFANDSKKYIGDGEIADFAIEVKDGKATLYLSHKPSNKPFGEAKVSFQPEGGGDAVQFAPQKSVGVYDAQLPNNALPAGDLILEAADETDSIAVVESADSTTQGKREGATAVAKESSESKVMNSAVAAILGALVASVIFIGLFLVQSRRKRAASLVLLSAATSIALLKTPEALAHGGHEHGDGTPNTETADMGSDVTIAKKSQFLIGVTSILAAKESVPEAMVSYGHVIPKPQLDATIIAPQAGIIRTASQYILGRQVARGETLATLDAVNQIRISSPISGQIQEIGAVNGARVENGAKLFHVTDTSTVWVDAELFAADLNKLKEVTDAYVSVEGTSEGVKAKLLNIVTPISEETRTAKAYLELDNTDGALRLGSLAKISFALKKDKPSIAVPTSAVLNRGGEHIVFVQTGPETFTPRQVRTESSSRPGTVLITQGVNEGERVVVTGNYQLLLKVK